jgi:citrate synthase
MNRFSEDPNLCSACQKLGYCAVKAMQAEAAQRKAMEAAEHFQWQQQTSFQSPMLSADPEPMPSFREFVAVHRPDLSKFLPREANGESARTPEARPSLAALRARIAARKSPAIPETPVQHRTTTMRLGSILCHLGNHPHAQPESQANRVRKKKKTSLRG